MTVPDKETSVLETRNQQGLFCQNSVYYDILSDQNSYMVYDSYHIHSCLYHTTCITNTYRYIWKKAMLEKQSRGHDLGLCKFVQIKTRMQRCILSVLHTFRYQNNYMYIDICHHIIYWNKACSIVPYPMCTLLNKL